MWFILIVSVCPLPVNVFDFLFILIRTDWWSSAGKELSSWLSACAVLLYAVITVGISFPSGAGCGISLYRVLMIAFLSTLLMLMYVHVVYIYNPKGI